MEHVKRNTFDTVHIYQGSTLYLSCKPKLYYRDAASIDLKLHKSWTPTQTLRYVPKLLKESLVFRACLVVGSFFPMNEDHNYVFQTYFFSQ